VPRTSLSAFTDLLFSVFAFGVGYFVVFSIIRKFDSLSSTATYKPSAVHFLASCQGPQYGVLVGVFQIAAHWQAARQAGDADIKWH